MADIRNDQYLHRPGAGRGAVTPTDPMEVRIFDGAGNPVAPATEGTQAQILSALGNLENTIGTEATLAAVKSVLDSLTEFLNTRLNANLSTLATNTSLNTVRDYIGSIGDAAASAGGTGSVSAKLRRLTADLADVLARLNADLPTRASEQTLVQVRDALSALASTVDAGAQKVTLTGRLQEQIFARSVRAAGQFQQALTVPTGVRGVIVGYRVYGVTGTSPQLTVYFMTSVRGTVTVPAYQVSTSAISSVGSGAIIVHPGASQGDAVAAGFFVPAFAPKIAGLGLMEIVRVAFSITGTFNAGEGFDTEAWIQWLI